MSTSHPLAHRGVNYDVGTDYDGHLSSGGWDTTQVRRDLMTIRDSLHCNSVSVYGSDPDRLGQAARIAADLGLAVWVQPRRIEGDTAESAALLAEVAAMADDLRGNGTEVVLNLGCEFSIFASGIMPGRNYAARSARLSTLWWLLPLYNARLNRMLAQLAATARQHFGGRITYGAALWESVDWTPFDIVGQNYYRLKYNQRHYAKKVARFKRHGKPVVITEFGCCAYEGAAALGPSGYQAIDFSGARPQLRGNPVRDEEVQARYITELLEVYRSTGMDGAFVFEYVANNHPYSPESRYDLDMAGFALVRPEDRRPKAAFEAVARSYREAAA